jgi:APA family basic amino acid/polyamine antiporter
MSDEQKLIRAVGFKEIVSLTINSIIGAGIFALPATAAKLLGLASPIAFLLAGILALIVVLCFAELGGRYDRTGGAYLYVTEAFGAGVFAFVIGWMYFLARLTSVAALSNAMMDFVTYLSPVNSPVRELLILLTIFLIGIANYIGVRFSSRLMNAFTAAKLIPLFLFIFVGICFVNWKVFSGIHFPELRPLSQTLLVAIFVFSGFEIIGVPAGEIVNPQKTLPRGLLVGTVSTIVIYFLIQVVAVANEPDLASSKSPIADAISHFLGASGAAIITVGAVLSTIGTILALILAGPRILYAMSLQNQMPHFFSNIHPRFRTPHVAILLFTIAAAGVALSGKFSTLATLSAMARLITYIGSALALLRLRSKDPSPETFRVPGGSVLPVLTILLCISLLSAATRLQLIAGSIALVVGLALFVLRSLRGLKPTNSEAG